MERDQLESVIAQDAIDEERRGGKRSRKTEDGKKKRERNDSNTAERGIL
jgi:hypothetical protein